VLVTASHPSRSNTEGAEATDGLGCEQKLPDGGPAKSTHTQEPPGQSLASLLGHSGKSRDVSAEQLRKRWLVRASTTAAQSRECGGGGGGGRDDDDNDDGDEAMAATLASKLAWSARPERCPDHVKEARGGPDERGAASTSTRVVVHHVWVNPLVVAGRGARGSTKAVRQTLRTIQGY
jgi:hypothetical protein